MARTFQTAIIQSPKAQNTASTELSLTVAHDLATPCLPLSSPYHVLIRVLAVALNPTDFKIIKHFAMPGRVVGCYFCGVVEVGLASHPGGTRVCGGMFPARFSQYVVVDVRLLIKVPSSLTNLQGAALGGVGWGTAGLALLGKDALSLPEEREGSRKSKPILVYGGATATGTMALQVLKMCAFFGPNTSVVHYTSPDYEATILFIAQRPIRHVLDCITSVESAATCFRVIARVGGRYACLEMLPEAWRTRRAVKIREVMGYECLGVPVDFGPESSYSRKADTGAFDACIRWAKRLQDLVDSGLIQPHPIREIEGKWDGIIRGLHMQQRGEVRGEKPVVNIEA
ncbi:putative zinc binding dehydrogenase [Periconia macrospinosa]|uniref:Putative zinc binding dehydrogenase n=1 Tax=Periconia macrospinosa TaxID=97972 RepID=A0A2V1DA18_9PLEO|nr:putative zinc binding dehydrogenase [Periconia macrospinosa]